MNTLLAKAVALALATFTAGSAFAESNDTLILPEPPSLQLVIGARALMGVFRDQYEFRSTKRTAGPGLLFGLELVHRYRLEFEVGFQFGSIDEHRFTTAGVMGTGRLPAADKLRHGLVFGFGYASWFGDRRHIPFVRAALGYEYRVQQLSFRALWAPHVGFEAESGGDYRLISSPIASVTISVSGLFAL